MDRAGAHSSKNMVPYWLPELGGSHREPQKPQENRYFKIETRDFEAPSFYLGPCKDPDTSGNTGNRTKTIEKHKRKQETIDIKIETRSFEASSFYLGPCRGPTPAKKWSPFLLGIGSRSFEEGDGSHRNHRKTETSR